MSVHAATYAGHVPALSTGHVPLGEFSCARDKYRMSKPGRSAPNSMLLERLDQRRAELGLSDRQLSLQATGKPDLVRDMRRKGHLPSAENLEGLAVFLGVSVDWLLGKADDPDAVISDVAVRELPREYRGPPREGPAIPLLGTGDCADIELTDENGELVSIGRSTFDAQHQVRLIARPPALRGARDLYAIYFQGESMAPRFEPGEVGIVDPSRPVRSGDYVLVQLNSGESEEVTSVLVKRLVHHNSQRALLEQFNPAIRFTVPRARISRIHRILPQTDLLFG